ncbi:hypothetical protein DH2020_049801 [Rehmannia glutinosa]|uniref:CONSTANS-like protein n=1 Tax=Rehmannia glutinosa TaxID=99300 RepID=A0ABR0U1Y4_REHGL
MASDRKLANILAGKSARACDNCVIKRARWYCAADDAFLCQSCDSSVHSANTLARRHDRVRLKTASFKSVTKESEQPTWHQGFTRKARTPRQKKPMITNPFHDVVPEICNEEQSTHEENEEQNILFRVPIFDPYGAELCNSDNLKDQAENMQSFGGISKAATNYDFELDLDSLLGKGLEDEAFDIEKLGFLDCNKNGETSNHCFLPSESVKFEDKEVGIDVGGEIFEMNFEYGYSPIITCELGEDDNKARNEKNNLEEYWKVDYCNKTFLKLDYEGVMLAWDDGKSPWTTGERPEFNSGDCWRPGYDLGTIGTMHVYGDMGMMSSARTAAMADGGREARVSRYREKRRTRLFSKKIRYEVRKLNAEKRPRMKGRFVKKPNFVSQSLLNK